MKISRTMRCYLCLCWIGLSPIDGYAQLQYPEYRMSAAHNQGNIQLNMNPASWGVLLRPPSSQVIPYFDPITNDTIYGCTYPRGSRSFYGQGDLFIAAINGSDTLACQGLMFGVRAHPLWTITSINSNLTYYSPEARSELDLECENNDTATGLDDILIYWERGPHLPLGVVVKQRSMAWSGGAVDDFILIEYEITNYGRTTLQGLYAGQSVAPPGWAIGLGPEPGTKNLTGFLDRYQSPGQCGFYDTLNIAYLMDNDGDPVSGRFTSNSRRGVVGTMLLGDFADSVETGYQWYFFNSGGDTDWGPRRRPQGGEFWRSFNPYFAWPGNDRNWYHILSHPHIAYDQIFTAIEHDGWMPPGRHAETIASGWPLIYEHWFGPFELGPKEHINFTVAVVGGDNVHTDPYAHFDPYNPQLFYDQLDFSELATNARWAQWVYDNPGFDTDSDGYAGEFRICEGDTVWYKGDGVPDFRGNTPPPAPFTRVLTEQGRITVRWNGYLCETTKDPFSNLVDFEGYRVYSGLDTRRASLSILTSYDRENFFRLKWHNLGSGKGKWLNDEPPYSLDELRIIHNDPNFDPHRFTRARPLFEGDSVFQFQMIDGNQNSLNSPHGIRKAFPDAINPGTDSTLWTEDDVTQEHGRALPKYYEYEYIIDGLLPTVPYFVSVTAFDFGYAGGRGNMPPDESNPLNNLIESYAQTSADSVETLQLDAYVYPNPYRADANYHGRGYENRTGRIIPNRARLLHFGNLPNVCKISIFSLDGDLIGTLDHNFPDGGPEAMHDWWNLVSRNGLAVESGMYYFVVESNTRTQIGKFVIIK